MIDDIKYAELLRERVFNKENKKLLVSRISSSKQSKDLSVPPNCNGFVKLMCQSKKGKMNQNF